MEEYENDRWRIISGKVGNGFSAAACKDKATELEAEADEPSTTRRREPAEDPAQHDPGGASESQHVTGEAPISGQEGA